MSEDEGPFVSLSFHLLLCWLDGCSTVVLKSGMGLHGYGLWISGVYGVVM